EPQICVTLPILRGRDGVRRMGKSLDNYVGIGESAYEMFAKIMSVPDSIMREWFALLTECSDELLATLLDPAKTHPMEAKMTLGRDIVGFYHGAETASAAQKEWEQRFSEKQDPTEIAEKTIPKAELTD